MKNIKYIFTNLLITISLGFSGCSSDDSVSAVLVNSNEYNLAQAMISPYSGLLDLTYSTGDTGSMYISKTVIGSILINGQTGTLLSQPATVSVNGTIVSVDSNVSIDSFGNTVKILTNDGTNIVSCDLTSSPEPMPTNAKIGTKSTTVRTYNCDDGSLKSITWELKDAGNDDAKFVFRTIVSGAYQSESLGEVTFSKDIKPIYYKVNIDYKNGLTAEAKGQLN